ncbi:acyltransferase family protein [Citrobacter cronae]|uniref:acyltransferase family protein n=1 Tax=Citrobacter cronae TaxID=1748967 RepID=UPI0031295913|nr:acyltransferase family protein [Citrobacter cronae]
MSKNHQKTAESISKRNQGIDLLKGIAIILVVWGHSIQYLKKDGISFFDNYLFITIYSFHMPLFMMISGYLFYYSLSKYSTTDIIIIKFKQLIIPMFAWIILNSIINSEPLNLATIKAGTIYLFWFLSALFALCAAYASFYKITKNYASIIFTVTFCISLSFGDGMNMDMIKFMAPYFLIGLLSHRYYDVIANWKNKIGIISISIWIAMLLLWRTKYYIYVSHMSFHDVNIWNQLHFVLFRYAIGFAGSFSVIYLSSFIVNKSPSKILSFLGSYTLPVYILSSISISKIASHIPQTDMYRNAALYNLIITPAFSFIVILLCIGLALLIKKNKIANQVLLGGR